MTETGNVSVHTVIDVLKANGVTVTANPSQPGSYTLSKGSVMESQTLPDPVERRGLHYLARKFGVAIHLFFHPEAPEVSPVAVSATVKILKPTGTDSTPNA